MNTKTLMLTIMIALFLTACGGSGAADQDQQLVYAQQTLDALNNAVENSPTDEQQAAPTDPPPTDPPPTNVLPTDVPPTDPPAPTATSAPENDPLLIELDDAGPAWNTDCDYLSQPMAGFGSGWNQDDHLFGSDFECEIAFDLPVSASGLYRVYLAATYAPDFGQLSLSFIGGIESDIVNISLYDPEVRPTGELDLGEWRFDATQNTQMVFFVYAKPEASQGYKFGLDYLKLELIEAD